MDWMNKAEKEVAALVAERAADPRMFYGKHGNERVKHTLAVLDALRLKLQPLIRAD